MNTSQPSESDGTVRWRSVYVSVVVFTAVIVLLLYLFSRWFAG